MYGYGLHIAGGPGTAWKVVLEYADGGEIRVILGPEHYCHRGGLWQATNPEQARRAAIEVVVDRFRQHLEQATVREVIERGDP